MKRVVLLSVCGLFLAGGALARKDALAPRPIPTASWSDVAGLDRPQTAASGLSASAVANTLVLASYTFNSGSSCSAQGWVTADLTAQTGDYWHVDDFALSNFLGSIPPGQLSPEGLTFTPIQGTKSMWMGQRIPPAGPVDPIHCGYGILTPIVSGLPGYGNNWDQSFVTRNCLPVTGNLDVSFKLKFDCQPSYDGTYLEYTNDCTGNAGWTRIDGGYWLWSGGQNLLTIAKSYAVGPGPVRVRIRFISDAAWSNQDGLYPGFGVAVDDLSVEGLAVEDFEDEAVGAHQAQDWETANSAFGDYMALFKKTTGASYEDNGCIDNLSCYWAAIQGSSDFYSCGAPPDPSQRVVPYGYWLDDVERYISNEIWSPVIPMTGTGSEFRLRYAVYRNLPLDNLVFYTWHVRTIDASGCPGPWKDRGLVYYSDAKDWYVAEHGLGPHIDINNGVGVQVALGVVDLRPWYAGILGSGDCHSPAPYIDNVTVMRVDVAGPQWDVREVDTFQDTFSADGTITGTARVNTALDIKPPLSPTYAPGDSALVLYLVDPKYIVGSGTNASGLLADPNLSTFVGRHKTKKQAYMYVAVWPQGQAAKTGAPLSEGPGGPANRYAFAGTTVIDGVTWTKIRMDYTYRGSSSNPGVGDGSDAFVRNQFNVDLNDNLFTPGDTICYFFSATSADGTTYYSTEYGPTSNLSEVAANPMEVTILPAGGYNRGGDILFVDGADGTGVQPYYDGALMVLGVEDLVDRYDVRAPSSAANNGLAGRVQDVAAQLNACYDNIVWDCGSLSVTLGDGTGAPLKTDDYALLNEFLGNMVSLGGIVLLGDDVPERLFASSSASAAVLRGSYIPFTLVTGNHRASPTLFAVSPPIRLWPGRNFLDDFFVFGGCPGLSDFDVMNASGSSLVQMSYNTASDPNGAVLANRNGNAAVVIAGFSLASVQDDELDGISDRALFIQKAIRYSGSGPGGPVTGAGSLAANSLSQNCPNPFNPQTTIAFSLKSRANVELNVYDVGGRLVRTLANETRGAGAHAVSWDGRDGVGSPVASGVYFYRLTTPGFSQTKKMVLLK